MRDPRDMRPDPRELRVDPHEHMFFGGRVHTSPYHSPPRSADTGPPTPVHQMDRHRPTTAPGRGPMPRGDPRDLRIDPRADPRMDPRADPRMDPRTDPRMDPRGDPRGDPRSAGAQMRLPLPPLGSRIDGPPTLGSYARDPRDMRDPRMEERSHPGSHPGSHWSGSEGHRSHPSESPSPEPKAPIGGGRMGLGHLVD
jgi:hypothetical protein